MSDIYINPLLLPMLNGKERFNVAYGGRDSGKSWGISDILLLKSMTEKDVIILCAKGTMKSIKDSVKSLIEKQIKRHNWESFFYITKTEIVCTLTNSVFIFSGLTNPDRIKSIESVKYLWIEEAAVEVTEEALDVVIPTLRTKGNRLFFTFNPKKAEDEVYKRYITNSEPNTRVVNINYYDNPYCSEESLEYIANMKKTNIEKYNHIYGGELVSDFEGALFKYGYYQYADIEIDELESIVVAVDPSGSDAKTADEAGIIVGGKLGDNAYILQDASKRCTPLEQAQIAIRLFKKYDADYIVVEKNGVGAGFKTILNQIDKNIPVKEIIATKGKKIRALPVSTLYESGRVYHKEVFSEMEYEMASYTEEAKKSPNRLDACVYVVTQLLLKKDINNNGMLRANKNIMRGL